MQYIVIYRNISPSFLGKIACRTRTTSRFTRVSCWRWWARTRSSGGRRGTRWGRPGPSRCHTSSRQVHCLKGRGPELLGHALHVGEKTGNPIFRGFFKVKIWGYFVKKKPVKLEPFFGQKMTLFGHVLGKTSVVIYLQDTRARAFFFFFWCV